MEALLKRELGYRSVKAAGHSGGGCISQGQSYDTDRGRVFVKVNTKAEARRMFEGELASLTAILKTGTVRVPKPIKVLDAPGGGSLLVMEHLDMRSLGSHAATLGVQLADLHLDKAPGFERRHQLYQLFHYLNHWNHFGAGYRGSSLSIMRNLVR